MKQQENSWNCVDQIINKFTIIKEETLPTSFCKWFWMTQCKSQHDSWPKYSVALKYTSKPKPCKPYVHYESITIKSHIFIDK
jgi:hypothetical protein